MIFILYHKIRTLLKYSYFTENFLLYQKIRIPDEQVLSADGKKNREQVTPSTIFSICSEHNLYIRKRRKPLGHVEYIIYYIIVYIYTLEGPGASLPMKKAFFLPFLPEVKIKYLLSAGSPFVYVSNAPHSAPIHRTH